MVLICVVFSLFCLVLFGSISFYSLVLVLIVLFVLFAPFGSILFDCCVLVLRVSICFLLALCVLCGPVSSICSIRSMCLHLVLYSFYLFLCVPIRFYLVLFAPVCACLPLISRYRFYLVLSDSVWVY